MSGVQIPAAYQARAANLLAQELKMEIADAEALVKDGTLTAKELWEARQKMRAYPSERSLSNTAAVKEHGFLTTQWLALLGVKGALENIVFDEIVKASGDNGSLDNESELTQLENALRTTILTSRNLIIPSMEKSIVQFFVDINQKTTGENHFRIRAVDLDCLKELSKTTFGQLVELSSRNVKHLRQDDMDLDRTRNHFGNGLTEDELEVIQEMDATNLTTITSLPKIVTQTIDPSKEKTENDILLSLVLSSPTPADAVVRMLFDDYYNHPGQHPVYLNTQFMKRTAPNQIVLHLTIEGKFFINDRVTYMTYTLSEGTLSNGLKQYQIIVKKVGGSAYALPPLRGEPMVTMEGAITITERSDGGSEMRLDVIGNPGIDLVPDFVLRDILEAKYTKLAKDGAAYLAKIVFVQCLKDEFQNPNTRCRGPILP